MISDCYVVGICGGTCSGKTTLAKKLHDNLEKQSNYLSQDSYYIDQSYKTDKELKQHNFDHPESVDLDLLHEHILRLKDNKEIQVPNYCFKTHSRLPITSTVCPSRIIILEGILIFSHEKLRDALDLRVFVDVDADIRLIRRIKRDCVERDRSTESVIEQYLHTVKPMHDKYVESYKNTSDYIVVDKTFSQQEIELKKMLVNRID
ncbi:MAG: uridine kinase [Pseudomonadota bacterium]